jgi:hypothetical protein
LAVFEALTGLEFEEALEVVTRVQRLLQECVKVRRGGDPEAEQQQQRRADHVAKATSSEPVSRSQAAQLLDVHRTTVSSARTVLPRGTAECGNDASAVAQSAARSMIVERSTRRRGGDRHAAQRRELHDGLPCIASLLGLGEGKRVVEVAREITDRCNRYQPMPVEGTKRGCTATDEQAAHGSHHFQSDKQKTLIG